MQCPRELSEKQEPQYLSQYAAKSTDPRLTQREHQPYTQCPFRTEYERDYTRIIHSRAFRRLRHKTQVFIHPKNDHVCTRLEHSLHVASISRTISKALGLNNDLVAAIAVGHDLGHAPFGHRGEECLRKIATQHNLQFQHECQSLRVVDELDSPYETHSGLNLTFAVRDGILTHCGETFEQELVPDRRKEPKDLLNPTRRPMPATLEGCVVRMADKVAYLGRDLEDAVEIGNIVKREDLPGSVTTHLGKTNGQIIGKLIRDIHKNSLQQDCIRLSPEVHRALVDFNRFSQEKIYADPCVTAYFGQIEFCMKSMFNRVLQLVEEAQNAGNLEKLRFTTQHCQVVLADFLDEDIRTWQTQSPALLTMDFIAGMTDFFFIRCFEELFLPRSTI